MLGIDIPNDYKIFQHENLLVLTNKSSPSAFAYWSYFGDNVMHYVATLNPLSKQRLHVETPHVSVAEEQMHRLLYE
jgi:hypothetical protein